MKTPTSADKLVSIPKSHNPEQKVADGARQSQIEDDLLKRKQKKSEVLLDDEPIFEGLLDDEEIAAITDASLIETARDLPTYLETHANSVNTAGQIGFGALEAVSSSSLSLVGGGVLGVTAIGSGGGGTSGAQEPTNNAPILVDSAVYMPQLVKTAPAPIGQAGMIVGELTKKIFDQDATDPKGVAITKIDHSKGALFYSLDDGASWSEVTSVSESNALLLSDNASTRVYFRPTAEAVGIVPNVVTYRAWDQTTGSNGARGDVRTNGGSTSFSSDTETISLSIQTPIVGDYIENGGAVIANPNIVLPQPLSGSFTGAVVQIGSSLTTGDILSVITWI